MKSFTLLIWAGLLILLAGIWLAAKRKESTLSQAKSTIQTTNNVYTPKEIEIQPFVTEAGWGYIIYMRGKPYIRQDNIPVVEGNKGFSTREKALKAGQLVAYKIEHAILPPTVSKPELDSLQLLN